jgi:hypothetical protein
MTSKPIEVIYSLICTKFDVNKGEGFQDIECMSSLTLDVKINRVLLLTCKMYQYILKSVKLRVLDK